MRYFRFASGPPSRGHVWAALIPGLSATPRAFWPRPSRGEKSELVSGPARGPLTSPHSLQGPGAHTIPSWTVLLPSATPRAQLSPRRASRATLLLAEARRLSGAHGPSFLPRPAGTRGHSSPSVYKEELGELLGLEMISCETLSPAFRPGPSWFLSKAVENLVFFLLAV